MKALKSKLASQLLADPMAGNQFREFLVGQKANSSVRQGATGQFVVRGKSGALQVMATVVPKAAKAA
ncbi:hypothetical protein [Massilia soli]|nr:hypothetical protein [Massilia soli]